MNRLQLAILLSWAGAEGLKGRKRLQKIVFFLQEAGCPLGCKFILHHFGPYSRDVADACDEIVTAGLVKESLGQSDTHREYSYTLPSVTRTLLQHTNDPDLEKYRPLGERLIKEHIWTLELGSTILYYFRQLGGWDEAFEKACEMKNSPTHLPSSQASLEYVKEFVRSQS